MASIPYPLIRPFLFRLEPERAHELTLSVLDRFAHSPIRHLWTQPRVHNPVTIAGLNFPNRIGLAAGLDKNGRYIDALANLGFGFIEVGTVTPQPQAGNPCPRLFRLPQAQALINRFGFNNDGLDAFLAHVTRAHFRSHGGILGLNIGKNAHTPLTDATADYERCLIGVYPHADYVTVNISSPNTAQLRKLQDDVALNTLLARLNQCRQTLIDRYQRVVPLFLKISPDLDEGQVAAIADTLQRHAIDGVIATNTTVQRDAVKHLPHGTEKGGLSGQPLGCTSNQVIRLLRAALGPHYPIIGVGGVMSAEDARSKLVAGADLVQIYTGLIYHGPQLVTDAARAMRHR